VSCLTD